MIWVIFFIATALLFISLWGLRKWLGLERHEVNQDWGRGFKTLRVGITLAGIAAILIRAGLGEVQLIAGPAAEISLIAVTMIMLQQLVQLVYDVRFAEDKRVKHYSAGVSMLLFLYILGMVSVIVLFTT
ncbi:hypothetical protein ACFO4L_01380 [Bacillus daqingensis]|uniref:DUF4181 domain-containing protein n=1 Tax=Bacillus daqingensis TaxID=872396 RepID=A0ABV9NPC6_9BACI